MMHRATSMPWTNERTLPRLKRVPSTGGGVSSNSFQRTDSNSSAASTSSSSSLVPETGSLKRNFHASISPSISSHSRPPMPRRAGSLLVRRTSSVDQKPGPLLRKTGSMPNPSPREPNPGPSCHAAATDEIEPAARELNSLAQLFEQGQQSGHIKVAQDSRLSSGERQNISQLPSPSITLADSESSSSAVISIQRTPPDFLAPQLHKSRPLIPMPRRAGSLPVPSRCSTGVDQKDDANNGSLLRRAGSLPNPRHTLQDSIEPVEAVLSSNAHSKLGSRQIHWHFPLSFLDFGRYIFRVVARRTAKVIPLLGDGDTTEEPGTQRTDVTKPRTTSTRDVMKIRQRGHQSRQVGMN